MATATDLNPYQILDVSPDIDYVPLRDVYRAKIHEHLQKKISPIKFRRICRAYETLSDRDKREHYNTKHEWTCELSIDRYTAQQLAAEPDLNRDLKKRLEKASLTEINAQDPATGHTILYCGARSGNIEGVKFLTEHGAEPDIWQRLKSTALHAASFYGHPEVVRCLLASGADYRLINRDRRTAEEEAEDDMVRNVFMEMKKHPYVRVAADELDWFRENGLTQHQDTEYFAQRQTLLHCASKKGYFDMVRWLVEKQSANIDLVDFNGNTPLHLAAYGGYRIIVDYLLGRGCDSTLKNRWGTTAEEEGTKHGRRITDLFKSMRERDMFEMARQGVAWWFFHYFENRSIDAVDDKGVSLLYYACRYGQYPVAKWLLEHGANVNIQIETGSRSTPLHGAKFHGYLSVVALLLEYDADVNIKNDFGATVFDETINDTVDKNVVRQINELLLQCKRHHINDQSLDIHVFEDDGNSSEPIAKLKLGMKAEYKDLLAALTSISGKQYPYFSVARRALEFSQDDPTIISAVCRARYSSSKFIDTPICLIRHKTLPKKSNRRPSTIEQLGRMELRQIASHSKVTTVSLQAPLNKRKRITIGDQLMFTFSEGCITEDIQLTVTTLFSPDHHKFGLYGCLCFFKTELHANSDKLLELPLVSLINNSHARLYTLATPTACWFTSNTRKTRLPMIGGLHAFIRHVDVLHRHLTLPADMLAANVLEQPLKSRDRPVPCTCLTVRKHDTSIFPHTAYHGTNIRVIQSILLDGLVVPGTVVSSGIRVSPPSNHFARDGTFFHVTNFADAVFLSPSIHYSSDRTYATPFSDGDRQLIPVLECSVRSGSYDVYPSTLEKYTVQPDENIDAMEWRIKDPANIEINAVLFITKLDSITAAKSARIMRMT